MPEWFSLIFRYREKQSPDKLGKYPEAVQIDAFPERRYLWTSRIMVIFGVFSICFTIILALAIYVLLPLRSAGPRLYEAYAPESRIRLVPTAEVTVSAEDMMTEEAIHRYIRLRHEIPQTYADLAYRWDKDSEFFQLSASSTYYQFINKMDTDQLVHLMNDKTVREVEIQEVRQISPNLWQAKFATYTSNKDFPQRVKALWNAYLRVEFRDFDEETDKSTYLHNPQGLKVRGYSLGYVGDGMQSESYLYKAKESSRRHE